MNLTARFPLRTWVVLAGIGFVLATLVLNKSFRDTLHRRKELFQIERETARVTGQIEAKRRQLARLHSDPSAMELAVRQDLGYLKPGEREVRFIDR